MRYLLLLSALFAAPASATLITVNAGDYALGTDISTISPGATFSTYTSVGPAGVRFDPVTIVANALGADIAPNAFGHGLRDVPGGSTAIPWNFHNVYDHGAGAEGCLSGGDCSSRFYVLHAAFDTPTNYVGVDVHYDENGLDGSILRAFDSTGTLLATCKVWGVVDRDPQVPTLPGVNPTPTSPNCGNQYRRYDCNSSGTQCATDNIAFISLPSANIAYVLWGSEAASATYASISSLTYDDMTSVPEPASLGMFALGGILAVIARRRRVTA
jgi:PEP-CTERM motif-containing protein